MSVLSQPILNTSGAGRGTLQLQYGSTPSGPALSWEADVLVSPPAGTTAGSSYRAHGEFNLSGDLEVRVVPEAGDIPGAPVSVTVDLGGLATWDLDPSDQPGVHWTTSDVRLSAIVPGQPTLEAGGGQKDPASHRGDTVEDSDSRSAVIATTIGGSFVIPIVAAGTSDTWVDGTGQSEGEVAVKLAATMDIVKADTAPADLAVDDLRSRGADGGIDVSYSVNGHDLPRASTLALYWSSDLSFSASTDTLIAGSAITVQPGIGNYGPVHFDPALLSVHPPGSNYLLAVVDPEDSVDESDETNNVRVLFDAAPSPVVTFASSVGSPIDATLMQRVFFHVDVAPGAPQPTAYGLEILGAGNAPGGWTDWARGTVPDLTVTERLAGTFLIRAYAEFSGHRYYSGEMHQTVAFPTASAIARDPSTRKAALAAWFNTVKYYSSMRRQREEGFWITLDTATGKYGRSRIVYGPNVSGASWAPRLVNLVPSKPGDILRPDLQSAVYVVASFRTHAPFAFVRKDFFRTAGPSRAEAALSRSIPSLVFDYVGKQGIVRGGTAVNAAAMLYEAPSGFARRALTGLPQSQPPGTPVAVERVEAWAVQDHMTYVERARSGAPNLVFLGDSITQNWGGVNGGGWGAEVWNERIAVPPWNAVNFGIAGDTTANLLWRIADGELASKPKLVVLEIGTNDLVYGHSIDQTVAGIDAVITAVLQASPASQILLMGILPSGTGMADPMSQKAIAVNAQLAQRADGQRIGFLDIGSEFLNPDGSLDTSLYADDLHPNARGYALWADALAPILASGGVTPAFGAVLDRRKG